MAQELHKIESLGIIKRRRGRAGVTSYTSLLLFFLKKDLCIVKRYALPCVNVTALCLSLIPVKMPFFLQFLPVFSLRDQISLKV